MTKYHKDVLELYERIKKENRTETWQPDTPHIPSKHSNDTLNDYDPDESDDPETEPDYDEDYQEQAASSDGKKKPLTRHKREVISNEMPSKDLLNRFIYKKLTGEHIYNMLPKDLTINNNSAQFLNHAFNRVKFCNYSLGLDTNLEFYFGASSTGADNLSKVAVEEENDERNSEQIDAASSGILNLTESDSGMGKCE